MIGVSNVNNLFGKRTRMKSHLSFNDVQVFRLLTLYLLLGTIVLADKPKLLVVSYDGFRYDYFQRDLNPYMSRLRNKGSHSDYMVNIFVSKTFPNHHSMVTGLYAENHGVVDNEYYNVTTKKKVEFSKEMYSYDEEHVIPIWTLTEKQGKRCGSMMWPGSALEHSGINITFAQKFDPTINWTRRVDTVISWFKDKVTPIDLGFLYIEEPDKHGHGIGINDPRFNEILKELDRLTEYLHKKLIDNGLEDVNVIHLSDHGMATVTRDNIINITKYINSSDYEITGLGPGLNIYPKEGKTDEIYNALKAGAKENIHFEVYLRDEIPERYHYSKNLRIGSIFLTTKVGYTFEQLEKSFPFYNKEYKINITNKTEFGVHGYDNMAKEMRPFFFANGPAFLSNCKLKPFNNVDLYPLFCEILELKCPPSNGTLEELKNCLTSFAPTEKKIHYDLVLIGIGVAMIISIIGAFVYRYRKAHKIRSRYRQIINIQDADNMWDEK